MNVTRKNIMDEEGGVMVTNKIAKEMERTVQRIEIWNKDELLLSIGVNRNIRFDLEHKMLYLDKVRGVTSRIAWDKFVLMDWNRKVLSLRLKE